MTLSTIDWVIIAAFFIISTLIGLASAREAGKSYTNFFLSGRNMPWWLLGTSMVATTFSADTPNLVTDIVRKNGVAGNWEWWAFLLTGMLTVFVYARLWRRSGVLTDLEFYELRYSGKAAAFLRGFRAIYLGVFFNVMIMASVCLAAIKIGSIMLGLSPVQTILIASLITVVYSSGGGLRGVILTDFFQFAVAMLGTILAAVYIVQLPQIGGIEKLLANEQVVSKLNFMPDFNNMDLLVPLLIMPLAIQWWSVWYPGAEPGGGGYIAQRMLAAKDEKNAVAATLLFNIAHYALRPWPWILVALASIIVFPDFASLKTAFPNISESVINDDLAYPAMLTYLPKGLLGIVLASLIAAFMSTISTHLNWGSSYIVHDFYKRFVKPDADQRELVIVGRISTVMLMLLSAMLALQLQSAYSAFKILLQIGAGTGLLFILRWFWWRINAYSEIAAMLISFIVSIYFELIHVQVLDFPPIAGHIKLLLSVGITTIGWLVVTLLTPPTDKKTLLHFFTLIKPHRTGWQPILQDAIKSGEISSNDLETSRLSSGLLCMFIGCFTVYAALFGMGFWIYGNIIGGIFATLVTVIGSFLLMRLWNKV